MIANESMKRAMRNKAIESLGNDCYASQEWPIDKDGGLMWTWMNGALTKFADVYMSRDEVITVEVRNGNLR